jgi:hypothetical protein
MADKKQSSEREKSSDAPKKDKSLLTRRSFMGGCRLFYELLYDSRPVVMSPIVVLESYRLQRLSNRLRL